MYPQAPMVARLCLQELLGGHSRPEFVCPGVQAVDTSDYDIRELSLKEVLGMMKIRFDPARPSLGILPLARKHAARTTHTHTHTRKKINNKSEIK